MAFPAGSPFRCETSAGAVTAFRKAVAAAARLPNHKLVQPFDRRCRWRPAVRNKGECMCMRCVYVLHERRDSRDYRAPVQGPPVQGLVGVAQQ